MNATTVPPARTPHHPRTPVPRDDRDTRAAWACLVAAPVAFVLAFVVGEGLSGRLGGDGVGAPAWWVGVLSVVAALVVFCVPAALASWFGSRAHRRGDDRATVPAAVLVVLSLGVLAMNLLAWVLDTVARNF